MQSGGGRPTELGAAVISEFLSATALFRDLGSSVADQVSGHVRARDFSAGETILSAGYRGGELGIVFAGNVDVCRVDALSGAKTRLGELGVGESFGEVAAVIDLGEPTAIVAEGDSTILFLPKAVVGQLASKLAPFALALAKRISNRLIRLSTTALRGDKSSSAPPPPTTAPTQTKPDNADDRGVRLVRVASFQLEEETLRLVPARLIHQQRALPLQLKGRTLTMGLVDPFSPSALAELKRTIPTVDFDIVAITQDDFNQTIVKLKLDSSSARGAGRDRISADEVVYDMSDSERESDNAVRVIGDEVVNLATSIIVSGVQMSASDIHVENDASGIRVRYRVGGVLIDWDQFVPGSYAKGLVGRFKVLAGLDITERRRPQDGRIGLRVGRREIDLRLSSVPAMRGEKLVMRIFEAANMMRPLDQVFVHPTTLNNVRESLNLPYGAIIVAGPTGSGKSSTLYAALGERKRTRPDSNIIMLEDPVEYRLEGVTQIQVNPQVELTFARILRAVLRQDPDVLMVGEIRDRETAELALEAAMTGHLLLTSIHANNALAAVQRLINIGCEQTAIAQSLALVLVQRLVGRMCSHCVVNETPPPILHQTLAKRGIVEASAPVPLPRARGCDACNQTGQAGRIAVIESLLVTDAVRNELMAGTPLGRS